MTELAEITGGTWAGGSGPISEERGWFSGISIDTRTLKSGDVFFCLKGANTDGHRFARRAARGKAAAIVVNRRRRGFARPLIGVPVLHVDDPLTALVDWAGRHRRRFDIRFAAITGSVGKTSTKDMLAEVMAQKFPTFKTPGNYNNLLGIPLALQKLSPRHSHGVVEMGMSSPGEITRLVKMIDPEIGVVTWIGPAHLEFFRDVSAIARAKRELFDHMAAAGLGVVNIDNPILARWKRRMKRALLGYSVRRATDVYATDIRLGPGETVFRLNGKTLIKLPVMGTHAVSNALAACAVARLYGIGIEKVRRGLARVRTPAGRLSFKKIRSITILDDTYNSNPTSAIAALDTLCALRPPGRLIACLGEMCELGVSAQQHHRDVGRAAAVRGVDVLMGVGYWGRLIVAGAKGARTKVRTHVAADTHQAIDWLKDLVRSGDIILIKASRAKGFDRIVAGLTNPPGKMR